ncbi:hypothetical protein [Burkholderia ambifaria]|uniref:Uncharacterized protein n=1 Tax=Burkholderia ambifaria MEX-5 TaxID=396597 RepID=B1T3Q9_9BURK|nr:hypothetical protein [Burkholderia ambifaria]EDT41774.1 conserved hypothetical protein [Burkholderia ambifaria MEX-5]
MADSDWAGYVGMATGLFGAVMGYVGYRRSNQIKALDMRLALRKDLGEARESVTMLRELMASAAGSRRATLAARGLGRSGAMVIWEQALEADRTTIEQIAASIRSEGTDFAALSEAQLETELVAVHKIKMSLATLVEKYRGELAADDDTRRQIGQQQTAIAAARMSQKQ